MMPPTLEDWRVTLRCDFQVDEGRFLAIAQDERHWDKAVFRELIEAMRDYCVRCANDEQLDRWMAHGFFYVPAFVRLDSAREIPSSQRRVLASRHPSLGSLQLRFGGGDLRRKKARLMS